MKRTTGSKTLAAAAMSVVLTSGLVACGGGSGSNNTQDTTPPDTRTAIQSVTVFGDSLSDVGTYKAATGDPANPGKFTVNPGKVWVENIADFYGLTVSPNRSLTLDATASGNASAGVGTATVIGGNGYAEGGARVDALPSESGIGNNQLVAPVSQQVNRYLAAHSKFPSNELVIVDGGGNDTYAQFSAVCWGTEDNGPGTGYGGTNATTLAIATSQIEAAANAQVANIRKIHDNGAPVVLVAAASDWSGNPFGAYYLSSAYQATGCYTPVPASQITAWTTTFNRILKAGIAGLSGVTYLDIAPEMADAVANPGKFGLVNVTAPACVPSSAAFCTSATLVAPDAAQTYLWSDAFHPTPRGHKIFSDAALNLLKSTTKKPG
ncbi:SGNH/GDSL hydrolase family protein [Variovorax sp. J22R133]|uniref:SGNH/GDSL hydrolase family protein n=1 Tax=Variovorax brevis TaxID=3053503 RepID=UPI00257689E7|nr:SGNH/GDSL hydrolase family protein [Variovorax sp. J22R133]MDM0111697.1 SGNH/GDSL hydrolase family protein [Variovorax sp. J22R133]